MSRLDRPAGGIGRVARETLGTWTRSDAIHWGAALAYYALFSLGPILILMVGISGLVLDASTAGSALIRQLRPVLGSRGASVAETILAQGSFPGFGSLPALGSLALLLVAATAVFANLRGALNATWSVRPSTGPLRTVLRARLTAFTMILIVGLLVVASLALGTVTSVLAPVLERWVPGGQWLVQGLDALVSVLMLWLAFAAIFRVLPDVEIAWRDVWVGALVTALLFVVGKVLISLYLAQSDLASPYGAAGSTFLLLVWIYYSAQIFMLGATFTRVWARLRGRPITAEVGAVRFARRAGPDTS